MKPIITNYDKLENVHFGDVIGENKNEAKSDKATHIGEFINNSGEDVEYPVKSINNITKIDGK